MNLYITCVYKANSKLFRVWVFVLFFSQNFCLCAQICPFCFIWPQLKESYAALFCEWMKGNVLNVSLKSIKHYKRCRDQNVIPYALCPIPYVVLSYKYWKAFSDSARDWMVFKMSWFVKSRFLGNSSVELIFFLFLVFSCRFSIYILFFHLIFDQMLVCC